MAESNVIPLRPDHKQRWKEIDEFPDYEVSNWGLIFNKRRKTVMQASRNNYGHMKITLTNSRGRHTRSVALLVAQAFVEPPDILCDQIVLLDGNLTNVAADNIVWRPTSFAYNYARQLKVRHPIAYSNLKVRNVNTRKRYACIVDAGMTEGLLFNDIWRSTYTNAKIYPHAHSFEIVERSMRSVRIQRI